MAEILTAKTISDGYAAFQREDLTVLDYWSDALKKVLHSHEALRARVTELEAAHLRCFNDLNLCAGKLIDAEAQLAAEAQSCEELIAGRLIALARIDHLELRVCEVVDERDALVIRLATSEAARVKAEEDKEKVHANTMQYAKAIEDAGLLLSCRPTGYKIINDPGTAYEILLLRARDAEQERDTAIRERDEALSTLAKWDLENNQLKQQLTRIRTALPAERAREIAGDCCNDRIVFDFDIEALRSYADILEDVDKPEPPSDALQAANKRAEVAEEQLEEETGIYLKIFTELGKLVNAPKGEPEPYVSVVERTIRKRISELERQNGLLREALEPIRKYLLSRSINLEQESPALRDDCIISECVDGVSLTLGMLRASIEALAPVEPQGEPAVKAQAFLDTFRRLGESNAEAARRFNEYEPTGTAEDQTPREIREARVCLHCGRTEVAWRYNRYPNCGDMAEPFAIRDYCMDCTRLQRPCMLHTPPPPACPNCAGLKKALEESIEPLTVLSDMFEKGYAKAMAEGAADAAVSFNGMAMMVNKPLASAKALLSGSGQEVK